MVQKTRIVEALGDEALLLPQRLADALTANDQAKYFFALLQMARSNAEAPQSQPPTLRTERLAAGVDDPGFDTVVSEAQAGAPGEIMIPRGAEILERVVSAIERMLVPLAPETRMPLAARLDALRPAPPEADRIAARAIDAMTSGKRKDGDSLHLLVMDAHKALNARQREIASETIDGAETYGLTKAAKARVSAFMAGLNRTRPLKFDHPGLDATAALAGETLLIQNDIGTTDAHVLVIRVEGRVATVTYTDIHPIRLRFFRDLFAEDAVEWREASAKADRRFESDRYIQLTGRFEARSMAELDRFLEALGSRLVFLIDWNKARKCLRRYMKNRRAVDALAWAAENGYGHRALLETGGAEAIDEAVEFAARARLRYGDRLDKLLGDEATEAFIRFALKASYLGLSGGRSTRLIRDELKAELARQFERSHVVLLRHAERHATLSFDIAVTLHDLMARGGFDAAQATRAAERAAAWESRADEALNAARADIARLDLPAGFERFFENADDAADRLEEAASLAPLFAALRPAPALMLHARALTELALRCAQDFVRAVYAANAFGAGEDRDDLDDLLEAMERITALEHQADSRMREARRTAIEEAGDFREASLTLEFARMLEEATDCYAHAAYRLRDLMMEPR